LCFYHLGDTGRRDGFHPELGSSPFSEKGLSRWEREKALEVLQRVTHAKRLETRTRGKVGFGPGGEPGAKAHSGDPLLN